MEDKSIMDIQDRSPDAPIHILIIKPGAWIGTKTERDEIGLALPKPVPGHHWEYQPMAAVPLRFATLQDGDKFMETVAQKISTDKYFVEPMRWDQFRKKWCVNLSWAQANGELAVFVQKADEAPPSKLTDREKELIAEFDVMKPEDGCQFSDFNAKYQNFIELLAKRIFSMRGKPTDPYDFNIVENALKNSDNGWLRGVPYFEEVVRLIELTFMAEENK